MDGRVVKREDGASRLLPGHDVERLVLTPDEQRIFDDGLVLIMKELHDKGGRTIAESEKTAVIFGMPHELIERDGADVVLPREAVANQLISWAGFKE